MAAKLLGCDPIIALDILPARLELAREFGATHTINCSSGSVEDIADRIMNIIGGINTAFDSTGSAKLMDIAVKCLRPGGHGCGVAAAGQPFLNREDRAAGKVWKEVIQGCSIPRLFIPKMIEYYRKGLFPFDRMITFFEFDQINEALAASRSGKVIKPVLIMDHRA
jgi:aryl-alcohol dehydrogenase